MIIIVPLLNFIQFNKKEFGAVLLSFVSNLLFTRQMKIVFSELYLTDWMVVMSNKEQQMSIAWYFVKYRKTTSFLFLKFFTTLFITTIDFY